MSFEAELPRVDDTIVPGEVYAAGFTPTKTGEWVASLLVMPVEVQEA